MRLVLGWSYVDLHALALSASALPLHHPAPWPSAVAPPRSIGRRNSNGILGTRVSTVTNSGSSVAWVLVSGHLSLHHGALWAFFSFILFPLCLHSLDKEKMICKDLVVN